MRPVNAEGIALIKRWEALRTEAYLCPAGIPTIGYGHTRDVKLGQKITEHQADVILASDLELWGEQVERLTPGANDNEFAAMVSFAYNLGVPTLARSSLLRYFLTGEKQAAAGQFGLYCHAKVNGQMKVLPGLVARRAAERDLFLKPVGA